MATLRNLDRYRRCSEGVERFTPFAIHQPDVGPTLTGNGWTLTEHAAGALPPRGRLPLRVLVFLAAISRLLGPWQDVEMADHEMFGAICVEVASMFVRT